MLVVNLLDSLTGNHIFVLYSVGKSTMEKKSFVLNVSISLALLVRSDGFESVIDATCERNGMS